MIEDFLLSNFETFVFSSICILVIGFLLLFLFQNQKHKQEKDIIFNYFQTINNHNKEIKEYLIALGNLLDQQKNEISKISEKIVFIEREISRLSDIKGSEDVLTNEPVEWVRVQIKETTEVNGVRFPSGIQIDVTEEDAKRMIEGNKAIMLEDTEENGDMEKNKEKI